MPKTVASYSAAHFGGGRGFHFVCAILDTSGSVEAQERNVPPEVAMPSYAHHQRRTQEGKDQYHSRSGHDRDGSPHTQHHDRCHGWSGDRNRGRPGYYRRAQTTFVIEGVSIVQSCPVGAGKLLWRPGAPFRSRVGHAARRLIESMTLKESVPIHRVRRCEVLVIVQVIFEFPDLYLCL